MEVSKASWVFRSINSRALETGRFPSSTLKRSYVFFTTLALHLTDENEQLTHSSEQLRSRSVFSLSTVQARDQQQPPPHSADLSTTPRLTGTVKSSSPQESAAGSAGAAHTKERPRSERLRSQRTYTRCCRCASPHLLTTSAASCRSLSHHEPAHAG